MMRLALRWGSVGFHLWRGLRALVGASVLGACLSAQGVVIDTGDGTGNTTPPGDDFGLENVGVSSNRSAVYLHDGWVLTADHVGERAITLLGQTYQPVAGSGVQLENQSGEPPDLFIYRIAGLPPLPEPVLSSGTPALDEVVYCAGNGFNREPTLTQWNVSWQTSPPPYVYSGYERATGRARRWGRNEVTDAGIELDIGPRTTLSLEVVFDETGGVSDEFQAWTGDSGGGCFAKRNGTWELVGVMIAQAVFGDPDGPGPLPPQPADTAVYGNATLIADVYSYRDQIEALTPALGAVPSLSRGGAFALALAIVAVVRLQTSLLRRRPSDRRSSPHGPLS